MTQKGTAAEGIFLKMLHENGIEAVHGSPSRPGDIIVPPDVIIEIKDPKSNSFSFRQHSGKGEAQWNALREMRGKFPWEIYYVIRFNRREWRYFNLPEKPVPLKIRSSLRIEGLFDLLRSKQQEYVRIAGVRL